MSRRQHPVLPRPPSCPRRDGPGARDHRARRRHRRRDPGPAFLDPRRITVVPIDGLAGDQHDGLSRGSPGPASSSSVTRTSRWSPTTTSVSKARNRSPARRSCASSPRTTRGCASSCSRQFRRSALSRTTSARRRSPGQVSRPEEAPTPVPPHGPNPTQPGGLLPQTRLVKIARQADAVSGGSAEKTAPISPQPEAAAPGAAATARAARASSRSGATSATPSPAAGGRSCGRAAASIAGRAPRPISRTILPPLPIRICFWLSVSV